MNKVQIVILAAGQGTRLKPLTENVPKTMLCINKKPIISYIFETFDPKDISEILVVLGHKKETIIKHLGNNFKNILIKYVENPIYADTNSTYSLWLAQKFFKEKIVIINGDTIFHKNILKNLINSKFESALAIDDTITLPLPDEAMKATIRNNKIIDVSKTISKEKTNGDAIGVYKFSGIGLQILTEELNSMVSNSNIKHLFTLAVKNILNRADIFSVSTEGMPWIEIDDQSDLNSAKDVINNL